MNYGYNMAASAVITAMFRQDVAANNLANIETVGFKPDTAFTIPRQAARQEDHLFALPSNKLLEKLGAGVFLAPTRTSHAQGALTRTGNPLDLAIQGEGFLVLSVNQSAGAAGQQVRLTRDGRLTLNDRGELVTVTGGQRVLDETGRTITLAPGEPVEIEGDGTIMQGGAAIARLQLATVTDKSQLRKVGHNQFAASAAALRSADDDQRGAIVSGHIEQSGVDAIQAMMAVQNAANAVSSATRLMSVHDEITGRMISTLGRVTA